MLGAGLWLGWRLRAWRSLNTARLVPLPEVEAPLDYVRETLAWCARMADAARVVLWQLDGESDRIIPIGSVGAARPAPQRLTGDPIAWAVQQNIAIRIDPNPTWSTAPRVFAVPVAGAGNRLALTIEIADPLPIEPSRFEALGLYVSAILSVESQRTALARQHARADDLIATLRALPAVLDAEQLSNQLARTATEMAGGTGGVLSLWQRDRGTVVGCYGDAPPADMTFGSNSSETALAIRAGSTLRREPGTLGNLPLVAPGERLARKPRAFVAVPLKVGGEVVGVLSAWSPNEITSHAVLDLETLAPYAALQLRQARELGQMRTLAERDALTGLSNRHAFDEFFAAESARYDRYQRPFSLIIFDLDHFKSVNDRFGHEAGDYILQQVADVIRASLRNVDLAARLGGEEFVVVLPETGLEKGLEIAERVRRLVAELAPVWRGQNIPVRVSAGVSAIPDCVSRQDDLLGSADRALYQAKNAGRNRVTPAPQMR